MFLCDLLKKLYLNYTWFSMVAMHGEEGDRRFYELYGKNKNKK